MAVITERLPRSQIQIEIEVTDERLESSKNQAVKRLGKQVRVPGFRPGKAPRHVLERTIGEGALLQEALDDLIPEVYSESIDAESIEPVGQPEFELKSTEPLVFSFLVPVRPTVDLKDHGSLRVPKPEPEARPELVEEALMDIRRRFATLDPVDRAIAWDDTVRADVTVSVEGQDEEPHQEQDAEFTLREGHVVSLPGFLEQLVGLEPGGPYEFEFALPEDFDAQDLAGKTAHYTVTVHEVKQEVLPDLDDELVSSLDEDGLETADQLRERVVESERARQQAEADARYEEETVDLLLATAEIDYPEVLVEREIDRLVDETSNHQAHTPEDLERWLQAIGKSEQEVRDSVRDQADLQVRRGLVLRELADVEGITVSSEDVDGEIDRMLDGMTLQIGGEEPDAEQRERLRGVLDTEQTRSSSENQLLMRRTLERLAEICQTEDEGGDEAEPARGTRRRRSPRAVGGGGTGGARGMGRRAGRRRRAGR